MLIFSVEKLLKDKLQMDDYKYALLIHRDLGLSIPLHYSPLKKICVTRHSYHYHTFISVITCD